MGDLVGAQAQSEVEDREIGFSAYGNGEKRFSSDKKDFVYKCINNNEKEQIIQPNPPSPPNQPSPVNNNVYVVWHNFSNSEIFFTASRDGGQTFSSPQIISNTLGVSTDPQITSQGDNVYVVWRDNTPGNFDIFFTMSSNGGLTFSTPENISETPGFSANPQISVEGNNVYVVWRDTIPQTTNTEILFAVSDDTGLTFSPF